MSTARTAWSCAIPTEAPCRRKSVPSSGRSGNAFHAALGIHAHNDCELAVANSLAAVNSGAVQVQGTVNGIGERCGNANLCSVIPNLQLKMEGFSCLSDASLTRLKSTAAFVSEVSNLAPFRRQPFVGERRLRPQRGRACERHHEGLRPVRAH